MSFISDSNSTPAQTGNTPPKPRFIVGDIVYVILNIKFINGEIEHIFYKKNKVLTKPQIDNEYIYCLDKIDNKVFERHIYSAEQIRHNRFSCVVE